MYDWMSEGVIKNKWMSECMNEKKWRRECVKKWMNCWVKWMNEWVKSHQNSINKYSFTNTRVTNNQYLWVGFKKSLYNESVSPCINGWNANLMELFLNGLPVCLKFIFPRWPVLLLCADIVFKDCILMREHRFNVSNEIIYDFSSILINSSSETPDQSEAPPFLQ